VTDRDVRLDRRVDGWSIQIPVAREDVSVSKRVALRQVEQHRHTPEFDTTQPLQHVDDTTQPLHVGRAGGTLSGTGMEQDPLE
jgi:hypothetical protein